MNNLPTFELTQAIGFFINRAAFLMTDEMQRRIKASGHDLSTPDFSILYHISQKGAMTQVNIANMMMRDKTTITRRIDGLVKKQYVTRVNNPDDRRVFLITLTDSAHEALTSIIPLVAVFQDEVLSDISEQDKNITMQTLQKISNTLIQAKEK